MIFPILLTQSPALTMLMRHPMGRVMGDIMLAVLLYGNHVTPHGYLYGLFHGLHYYY